MKKSVSLLCNLLLSSALFWSVPSVGAEEMIDMIPSDTTAYCQMQFPLMVEDGLSWEQPILDSLTGSVVDFNGPCDYDAAGSDEIRTQKRVILRDDFDDGDSMTSRTRQ